MSEQLERLERLIGEENIQKLANARVAVFGIGGVGGYAVEALARSGVGTIDIVDHDVIDISNLNRQIIATHDTIGQEKVIAMEKRIKSINPSIKVNMIKKLFSEKNSDEFDFKQYDYIIDAIDTVSGKILLVVKAYENNVPIIASMGTGNKLDPSMLEIDTIDNTSNCPLAKVVRKELRKRCITNLTVVYSKEMPQDTKHRVPGSTAFVPGTAGLLMAGKVANDLLKNTK